MFEHQVQFIQIPSGIPETSIVLYVNCMSIKREEKIGKKETVTIITNQIPSEGLSAWSRPWAQPPDSKVLLLPTVGAGPLGFNRTCGSVRRLASKSKNFH